ncbi:MAG: M28 family peptidase [Saprospiraceae bacterium]|nr:M28 family peptidase [Saprospiraceae bacterium]
MRSLYLGFFLLFLLAACKQDAPTNVPAPPVPPPVRVNIPSFDPAAAFALIEKQVAFGPRNPGSPGHAACRDWLIETLTSYGAKVIAQDFTARDLTDKKYDATNIIASFHPESSRRVLLTAHWDTRAYGDYDPDENRHTSPIPGADDGGSGVAVLLEVARLLQANPIDFGVDIVLFDAEDQGKNNGTDPLSWCQGAQYWGKQPHVDNYKAQYGIHLDMVGAKNPRFGKEGFSRSYAPQIQEKVWKMAQGMGYGMFFVNDFTNPVTDDHKYINELRQIPTVNIINQPLASETGFATHWHTHGDGLEIIDLRSLKAVGQVVIASVYNTYMQRF